MSQRLAEELSALGKDLGGRSSRRVLAEAHAVGRLLTWCRRALAESHLVTVASMLHRRLEADLEELGALRLPIDVLEQFPAWRAGSRAGFRPRKVGLRPIAAGAGEPITALRVHFLPSSGAAPMALMLLRGLARRLDPATRFVVVVEPGTDRARLRRALRRLGLDDPARVQLLETESATTFAQDNARSARDAAGRPVLVVPRAFDTRRAYVEEPLGAQAAERALGMRVVRSALYWHGGNLVHDGDRCLIGADTIAENRARLGLSATEVVASFSAELGTEVAVLGDLSAARFDGTEEQLTRSGQSAFHIDLEVSLLGRFGAQRRPVALLADPVQGQRLVGHVLTDRAALARHFIPGNGARALVASELRAVAGERARMLARYRATLRRLGYRVVGIPGLGLRPRENAFGARSLDFGYCNVLPGLNRGRPAVHYLPWGIPALDRRAEACLRAAGVAPVRVSDDPAIANALTEMAAGLHCFCGPVA